MQPTFLHRLAGLLCLCLLSLPVLANTVLDPSSTHTVSDAEWLLADTDPGTLLHPYWQRQFAPVPPGVRLASNQVVWLRLAVNNPTDHLQVWWLDPWPLALYALQAYREDHGQLLPAGAQLTAQALPIALAPGTHTLYLRLNSTLDQPLQLHWLPDRGAGTTLLARRWVSGAALGALSLLAAIALGVAALYRDRLYALLGTHFCGLSLWFWGVWALTGPWQWPLVSSGLLLAGLSLPIMAYALPHQRSFGTGFVPLLAVLLVMGLVVIRLLPVSITLPILLWGYLLTCLVFVVMMGRLGMQGVPSSLELAVLQGLPLLTALALGLSADNSISTLLAPNPWVLGLQMIAGTGMLIILVLRTKRRWLDHEARQRWLTSVESDTRSRGDILSRISQEIRTPMSGILGMAELLQDTPLTLQQQEYLDTIQSSGHSLLNLIGEVLDDSTLTSEGTPATEAPFEPESLVLEVINGFRSLAEQRHTELICELPDRLPAVLVGDPVRLRQVLLHVIGHAVRTSTGSEITLGLACAVDNHRAQLTFTVEDHGAGLSQAAIARILGTAQETAALSGASAGLSVAHRLISMMHGHMTLQSDAQHTVVQFTLVLPIALENPPQAPRETHSLENRRLLVVDDSDTLRRTLCRQAERWGMLAEAARSGSEAIGQVRNRVAMNHPYDIVLLEYQLPGMNGIELARRIRQVQEPPPAILMLTGLRHFPGGADMQGAGIHRLLTKPATGTTLQLALVDALRSPGHNESPPVILEHPVHVLLAEDNPVTARVIEAMLKKLGAICQRVSNGQQALEACQLNHFELVLMDCDMPVMDGFEATRAIRDWERETGQSPLLIYALTAHILDEYRERSHRAGMNGHLGKPVNLQQLANVLETCLQANR